MFSFYCKLLNIWNESFVAISLHLEFLEVSSFMLLATFSVLFMQRSKTANKLICHKLRCRKKLSEQ